MEYKKNRFDEFGEKTDEIDVRISHRIIQLFSEGLYSSPNKAVEELVSNSFDAGAENVHVILSPDLRSDDATIAVIDDGEGMDSTGLKQHWIIGKSTRRKTNHQHTRKPIGKFGIGKLATYVLSSKLTHVCKSNDSFFVATMDYTPIEKPGRISEDGIFNEQNIKIPLQTLTEKEAEELLKSWTNDEKPGYKELKLFGDDASDSWTVAIMSNLKDMGKEVKRKRLKWILSTAMPLRDDFRLYLNGAFVKPSKSDLSPIKKWIIGKEITQLDKPCPKGLDVTEDPDIDKDSMHRFGLSHEKLGRITGYVEIYAENITGGKSDEMERSNGFFVYVRDRMVNIDDPGFGIERNLLRHGTFSRFRMVVHIDSLDEALRSSRESFQQGELYTLTQNFLRAVFNKARNSLEDHDRQQTPSSRISSRISSAPGSLTRKPLLCLAQLVVEKKASPVYLRFPTDVQGESAKLILREIENRAESEEGLLQSAELVPLDSRDGLVVFDIKDGILRINSSHPFVAAFQEFFTGKKRDLPLEMFLMTEVIMEAHLYYMGIDEILIKDILGRRDELLRQFVRSSARRTAGMIALALTEARDNANMLEEEMRAAFEAMGFANVIRIGGKGNPDGTAEAHLSATEDGTSQRYKVGLEAKSGGKVSANRLNIAAIRLHMTDHNCDHHIVIGNAFETSTGEVSNTVREINEHKSQTGKTITLMHIDDMARLIRIASSKRIGGLKRLRKLFVDCITPEESKVWVDNLSEEKADNWPYKEILETVWKLAKNRPNEPVEYQSVAVELSHREPPVDISKKDLVECCKSMQSMARGVVFARDNTVEIERRPDLILSDIREAVDQYPDEERKMIII